MNTKSVFDERRRLVAQSLLVGNPVNNARDLGLQPDGRHECQLDLSLDEIRPYEHNPRRNDNLRFDDIKESIRTGGLRNPLTVTRRPGDEHYIVESGGNTRLLAFRQLWEETRDQRFGRLVVLYRPWRSESHVLTAHLIENEQRGEMTFWDKATGIVALKKRLEAEQGKALTLRPLEDTLHALGLSVTTATLALYLFATERLSILGEGLPRLTGLDVKTLQPRLNALKRWAQAHSDWDEDTLYDQVFNPAFERLVGSRGGDGQLRMGRVIEACEVSLAAALRMSLKDLRLSLGADQKVADVKPGAPACDRLPAIASFAKAAGLEAWIQADQQVAGGVRLAELDAESTHNPQRRRSWWWLAVITGQAREVQAEVAPEANELMAWLLDPDDPSAEAALTLLQDRRQRRAVSGGQ
jgi:ParB family protein of integrating conjugative element (PFGI_1 class)